MFVALIRKLLSEPMRRPGLREFAYRTDGATVVEFGLVAAPFIALLFAILQTVLVFFAGRVLDTAVAQSARLILTGQAQDAGFNQSAFANAVCAKRDLRAQAGNKFIVKTLIFGSGPLPARLPGAAPCATCGGAAFGNRSAHLGNCFGRWLHRSEPLLSAFSGAGWLNTKRVSMVNALAIARRSQCSGGSPPDCFAASRHRFL